MNFKTRKTLYTQLERSRKSKVITFITGDRKNAEAQIAHDCLEIFVELLDGIGPTKRISLLLNTNGGVTAAAWTLVNLVRSFCDELEVIVPQKAMSAGTLISLGADKIVMTKQATLGPIDPSLTHPLGPSLAAGNQQVRLPVRGRLETLVWGGWPGSDVVPDGCRSLFGEPHVDADHPTAA